MEKVKTEIEISLSIEQLAEMFIHWGSDDQAKFINSIGTSFKEADFNAEMQCFYISDAITKHGKDFLYTMSNFVKVQKFKTTDPHFNMLIDSYPCDSLD